MSKILAVNNWGTNSKLIVEAVVPLGYLHEDWLTLDPTYGKGNWWKDWKPKDLTTHDLALDGVDFRALPEDDETFDASVYDGPYISPGGRKTSTFTDLTDRFGLAFTPSNPRELHERLLAPGLTEIVRVTRPKGFILVKCMDYISRGKYQDGTRWIANHAIDVLGLEQIDRFEYVTPLGPQSQKSQVHARRNNSTLFVFRKGKS